MSFENEYDRLVALEEHVQVISNSLLSVFPKIENNANSLLDSVAALAEMLAGHEQKINAITLCISPDASTTLKAGIEQSEFQIKRLREQIVALKSRSLYYLLCLVKHRLVNRLRPYAPGLGNLAGSFIALVAPGLP